MRVKYSVSRKLKWSPGKKAPKYSSKQTGEGGTNVLRGKGPTDTRTR